MPNTVEACNTRIDKVHALIKELFNEVDFLKERAEFLKAHPEAEIELNPEPTIKGVVYNLIKNNPGLHGGKYVKLQDTYEPRQIQAAIQVLSKNNLINNQGSHGVGARWFIGSSKEVAS